MDRRIVWTDEAVADLAEIHAFIARDSPTFAASTCEQLIKRCRQALAFPLSGRVVPEKNEESFRELFWRDYRLIYRVEPQRILIVTIIHGKRRLEL